MGRKPVLLLLASSACAAGNPLVQSKRPPQQTQIQAQVQGKLVANAHGQSEEAKDWVFNYLSNEVHNALQGTSLANLPGWDLMQRLDWEFKRLPLMHNGPMDRTEGTPWITDDTGLETSLNDGYLQNICQRFTLGAPNEPEKTLVDLHWVMTEFMGLPLFAKENDPTLREANNCIMYLASNLRKTHGGNFMYGSVTYVVNPIYKDKFAVAPYDSGEYHGSFLPFGTLEDYYHLFKNHVTTLNYNFAEVLKRWYISAPPPDIGLFPYFEVAWFGNAWIPESILYIVVKFSGDNGVGVWGTDAGRTLQQFMRKSGRPLLWADDDDSGMLIDPIVDSIAGGRITTEDADYFNSQWSSGISFKDLYDGSADHLKFYFQQYERKQICDPLEQDSANMIMGHDRLGNCVYWVWNMQQIQWECLNDGTCAKSDAIRGGFFSQQDCLANCGGGSWACVYNSPGSRPGSHHCEPNSVLGSCPDVDTCEAKCGPGNVCASTELQQPTFL